MNIKEYIASGILEDYVLGLASEEDAREIERLAKEHPEIQEEISAIQNSLEQYAGKFRKDPPASLKENIWSGIQEEEKISFEKPERKVKNLSNNYNYRKWLVAASVIFLIGSTIINITLYNKLQTAQNQLIALNTEKEYYVNQFEVKKIALEQTQKEYAFLFQPSTASIALKGVPDFPDALATVYWNKNSNDTYLAVNNLPAPPEDKQYQLWAIVEGKPVDAGVFEIDKNNTGNIYKMKSFETAQAFAITLEKKGGSPTPTMEAMYVIGNV